METRTDNCENLTSNKRRGGEAAIDGITSLPEHVLLHILSLLPTKDAVKTSALSKPWQFLWTSVPALDFSFPETTDSSGGQIPQSIDKTLTVHSSPNITKFSIDVPFEDALKPRVNDWVRFAVSRQVEVLKLHFRFFKPAHLLVLPSILYKNQSLTQLIIVNCRLPLPSGVNFPSLKKLYVSPFTDRSVGELLSHCPSLEDLTLWPCTGSANLKLSSTSLKWLSFANLNCNSVMEVWAPNLQSLILSQDCCFRKHRLMDVSSLVKVELRFSHLCLQRVRSNIPTNTELLTRFKELLQQLKKVEQLTFHAYRTTLKQEACDNTILDEAKVFWRSQQKDLFTCLQCALKRVRFIGFVPSRVGWEFVGPLVEFFLNNALMLEKMYIN